MTRPRSTRRAACSSSNDAPCARAAATRGRLGVSAPNPPATSAWRPDPAAERDGPGSLTAPGSVLFCASAQVWLSEHAWSSRDKRGGRGVAFIPAYPSPPFHIVKQALRFLQNRNPDYPERSFRYLWNEVSVFSWISYSYFSECISRILPSITHVKYRILS